MLLDRVSNPGPLTYESGALPIALRGPAHSSAIGLYLLHAVGLENKEKELSYSFIVLTCHVILQIFIKIYYMHNKEI